MFVIVIIHVELPNFSIQCYVAAKLCIIHREYRTILLGRADISSPLNDPLILTNPNFVIPLLAAFNGDMLPLRFLLRLCDYRLLLTMGHSLVEIFRA